MKKQKPRQLQLTADELTLVDKVLREEKGKTTDAWKAVNEDRKKKKRAKISMSAVHRYVSGSTHKRDVQEKRGRKQILTPQDALRLDQARHRRPI